MKQLISLMAPFISGALFAVGLGVSGMTEAKNILSFLDIFGEWDGALLFVMGGAIFVYAIAYRVIVKLKKPLFEEKFYLPTKIILDKRLLVGAVIFGIGWGVTGLCPGPGLVALVSGKADAVLFVITMVIGMLLGKSQFGKAILSDKS